MSAIYGYWYRSDPQTMIFFALRAQHGVGMPDFASAGFEDAKADICFCGTH
jgi:hypothetical protein